MEVSKLKKISKKLKCKAKQIDAAMDKYLPSPNEFPEELHKAMRYSVMNGGKRIRPILVVESAKLFGFDGRKVLPTACGIEMIHAYSLIHDDLPLLDNDDFRRGKPTCHKIFGDAVALLAGDALLTHAFFTISKNINIEGVTYDAVVDVIQKVSYSAGCFGMVGGQTVDIKCTKEDISKELLNYIHENKTGALFRASTWSGARLANASSDDLEVMDRYGKWLGLIFQITDDILDIKGDEKLLGKPVGSDEKNAKATFPKLYGYKNTVNFIKKLSNDIKELISQYPKSDFFMELVDFVVNRQY